MHVYKGLGCDMLYGKRILGTVAYMGGVMTIPERFTWSWGQMVQWNSEYFCNPGEIVWYDRATMSYHSAARNSIVDKMRGDWLLMLDTDHSFEPDICARMLNIMDDADIDVLTGIYQYKNPPYAPVVYRKVGDGFATVGDWSDGLTAFEIGSAGGGCLLVRKHVYDRIRDELDEGPFDIDHPYSEDHSFFRRLDKLGIKAYCTPKIQCHHLEVREIGLEDYDRDGVSLSEYEQMEVFI